MSHDPWICAHWTHMTKETAKQRVGNGGKVKTEATSTETRQEKCTHLNARLQEAQRDKAMKEHESVFQNQQYQKDNKP